jgi:hypothetical protein
MISNSVKIDKGRPARKDDNFTAICKPNVLEMCEPRLLMTLLASTYRYSFTLSLYFAVGFRLYVLCSSALILAAVRLRETGC